MMTELNLFKGFAICSINELRDEKNQNGSVSSGGSIGDPMGAIASPRKRARKILLNVSENKSSHRKTLSNSVRQPIMSNSHFESLKDILAP